jgi:hypothetical protein
LKHKLWEIERERREREREREREKFKTYLSGDRGKS